MCYLSKLPQHPSTTNKTVQDEIEKYHKEKNRWQSLRFDLIWTSRVDSLFPNEVPQTKNNPAFWTHKIKPRSARAAWLASRHPRIVVEDNDALLTGYRVHIVEKWITDSSSFCFALLEYTGNQYDGVRVAVLRADRTLSGRASDPFAVLKPKAPFVSVAVTPLGGAHVATHPFPSDVQLIAVPRFSLSLLCCLTCFTSIGTRRRCRCAYRRYHSPDNTSRSGMRSRFHRTGPGNNAFNESPARFSLDVGDAGIVAGPVPRAVRQSAT
jgi:hypothetical protein